MKVFIFCLALCVALTAAGENLVVSKDQMNRDAEQDNALLKSGIVDKIEEGIVLRRGGTSFRRRPKFRISSRYNMLFLGLSYAPSYYQPWFQQCGKPMDMACCVSNPIVTQNACCSIYNSASVSGGLCLCRRPAYCVVAPAAAVTTAAATTAAVTTAAVTTAAVTTAAVTTPAVTTAAVTTAAVTTAAVTTAAVTTAAVTTAPATTAAATTGGAKRSAMCPSTFTRRLRLINGNNIDECQVGGIVAIRDKNAKFILCTGIMSDASTVVLPNYCQDLAGRNPADVEVVHGSQTSAASFITQNGAGGSGTVTLTGTIDTGCQTPYGCFYNANMDTTKILWNKCSVLATGFTIDGDITSAKTSGATVTILGKAVCSALETAGIITADQQKVKDASKDYNCFTSSATPCVGDQGGPVFCQTTTEEVVIVGAIESFQCDSTEKYTLFVDYTKGLANTNLSRR
ncbi:uncharacterized protein LOC121389331 [Gigantopelta aegis]|uniref:uncharacterized protein LOC121389331 n=1 Tax=Gigantopelta aegis TaxID=1735272 RepID=UPI001B88C770|nr:uncharacterized protein LOC121389331 [Gigantopelta aegis]